MKGFYIKEVTAEGEGVRKSSVSFDKGLNIITGPSNTGKSYILGCIDFIFGSDDPPSKALGGYDTITVKVGTNEGEEISFTRALDSKHINVVSGVSDIESKVYKIGGSEGWKKYSDIFLHMIGIKERPKIYSTQSRKTQDLTWRTFLHTFFIDATRMIGRQSILHLSKGLSPTPTLSSLLFLITGNDIVDRESKESIDIKKAKKEAVKVYINEKLINSIESSKELEESLNAYEDVDFDSLISSITDEIRSIEVEIIKANQESREILGQAYTISSDLEEAKVLRERYQVLMTQYRSDEERLNFIVEGEGNKDNSNPDASCPLCDSKVSIIEDDGSYREAAKGEYSKLQLQKEDLKLAMDDINNEIERNEATLHRLNQKNSKVLDLINQELTPKIEELKSELVKTQHKNDMINQLNMYRDIMKDFNADLDIQEQEEIEESYNPLNLLPSSFFTKLNGYLDDMLREVSYPSYQTSRIPSDLAKNVDITVNGKAKKFQGDGYKAYLNTVFGFILMKYLALNAEYAPRMLFLDSPILPLKEIEDEEASEVMKTGLFQYLVGNQEYGQIIIAEHDIPELDYSSVNIIKFTKNPNVGRYGFLLDHTDD